MNQEIDKMLKQQSKNDDNSDMRKMLEKNLEMTIETYEMVKKIKSYIFWQQVFGVFKIIIIVVPIVLGIMYLSPMLSKVLEQYSELLDIPSEINPKGVIDLLQNQK